MEEIVVLDFNDIIREIPETNAFEYIDKDGIKRIYELCGQYANNKNMKFINFHVISGVGSFFVFKKL